MKELRNYQIDMINKAKRSFELGNIAPMVITTGAGKSYPRASKEQNVVAERVK